MHRRHYKHSIKDEGIEKKNVNVHSLPEGMMLYMNMSSGWSGPESWMALF